MCSGKSDHVKLLAIKRLCKKLFGDKLANGWRMVGDYMFPKDYGMVWEAFECR